MQIYIIYKNIFFRVQWSLSKVWPIWTAIDILYTNYIIKYNNNNCATVRVDSFSIGFFFFFFEPMTFLCKRMHDEFVSVNVIHFIFYIRYIDLNTISLKTWNFESLTFLFDFKSNKLSESFQTLRMFIRTVTFIPASSRFIESMRQKRKYDGSQAPAWDSNYLKRAG